MSANFHSERNRITLYKFFGPAEFERAIIDQIFAAKKVNEAMIRLIEHSAKSKTSGVKIQYDFRNLRRGSGNYNQGRLFKRL